MGADGSLASGRCPEDEDASGVDRRRLGRGPKAGFRSACARGLRGHCGLQGDQYQRDLAPSSERTWTAVPKLWKTVADEGRKKVCRVWNLGRLTLRCSGRGHIKS